MKGFSELDEKLDTIIRRSTATMKEMTAEQILKVMDEMNNRQRVEFLTALVTEYFGKRQIKHETLHGRDKDY